MSERKVPAARGRPPTVTRQRLADAGLTIGLPAVTVVGVAAQLGVSSMAIYKHVSGLDELKRLTAEEMFLRWALPQPALEQRDRLEPYLTTFAESIWRLVEEHPGIAPYLLRRDMITPPMMAKIQAHQENMARTLGLSFAEARWLSFTVAYHCVAIADTVLPHPAEPSGSTDPSPPARGRIDAEYASGIRALIVGALSILPDLDFDDRDRPSSG